MTLVEMAVAIALVLVGLFIAVGWTGNLREEAKLALARRVLAELDVALVRYHNATGTYPASHGPDSAIQATVYMLDHDKTRPILEAFPDSVWQGPGRRNLLDPWGTPLQYLPADSDSPYVKANGGRPVFVSAGPDCGFGDLDPSQLGDNLRSDDPGPDGFRLDQLILESPVDKEQSHGQENDRSSGGQ